MRTGNVKIQQSVIASCVPLRGHGLQPLREEIDNVGGPIADAVLGHLNTFARIAICGQISGANDAKPSQGPRMYRHLLVARARMQGFLVFDFEKRYPEGLAQLTEWVRDGKLKFHEDVIEGFENMPRALIGLFTGENIGKRVVKVASAR